MPSSNRYNELIEYLTTEGYNEFTERFERIPSRKPYNDFLVWLSKSDFKSNKKEAISHSTMLNVRKDLEGLQGSTYIGKNYTRLRSIKKKIKYFRDAYDYWDKNKDKEENTISLAKENVGHKSEIVFKPGTWFLYYYYLANLDDSKWQEPKIARFIFKVIDKKHFLLTRKMVGGEIEHCSGNYEIIDNTRTGVFDVSNNEGTYVSHFKINHTGDSSTILLGLYTSYCLNDLEAGTVLLQKYDEELAKTTDLEPLLLWRGMSGNEFEKLNEWILAYLALKKYNHLELPKDGTPNLTQLKRFLNKKSLFDKKNLRFVDFQKPKIFIATPQTSLSKSWEKKREADALKSLLRNLGETYKDLQIVDKNYAVSEKSDKVTKKICKELYRTKYFILILGDLNKVKLSFSVALLGQALGYCKNILVVYKKGDLSQRFEAIKVLDIVTDYSYPTSIQKNSKDILHQIKNFIENNS